jgi:hypothetical protein
MQRPLEPSLCRPWENDDPLSVGSHIEVLAHAISKTCVGAQGRGVPPANEPPTMV